MKVKVRYFGMLAEQIGMAEEWLDLTVEEDLDLEAFFNLKYPKIQKINYKIAINQELNKVLKSDCLVTEIALLPPFAGG